VSKLALSLPKMGELTTTLTQGVTMNNIAAVKANRNDSLVALCDAINLANEVGKLDAFLAALTGAVEPTPAPATPEPTVKSNDWKSAPASKKQCEYIPALAAKKGIHTMRNVKTGEMMPITPENVATMTKGGASKLYYALKNHKPAVKETVTVKPATITVKEARKAQKEARKAARKARNAAKAAVVAPIDWDTDGMDDLGYAEGDETSRIIAALDSKLYA